VHSIEFTGFQLTMTPFYLAPNPRSKGLIDFVDALYGIDAALAVYLGYPVNCVWKHERPPCPLPD